MEAMQARMSNHTMFKDENTMLILEGFYPYTNTCVTVKANNTESWVSTTTKCRNTPPASKSNVSNSLTRVMPICCSYDLSSELIFLPFLSKS